ncbi:EFR1 family ferrodoxin [Acetobacterium sp. K1/6]|uniref:EFR1 family ferrodoxin n=1 Tax=Acetobacterium sp. K1/6 TaxID=3055467 RepID=UPI002ACA4080|nr:EFR1 family ferrodoxin [Acetobacterium sp. K1/6]MDZ5723558.1 EFR1 family ferrodoxin [Acetobacterium sp. K1/6]
MDFKSANLVYFTGTGGTARVADAFERSFVKRSVTVTRIELKGAVNPVVSGELLVLLFPVYAFNAPKPVEEWLKKIQTVKKGQPAVVVSVSGGGEISPNTACRRATIRQLEKKGYDVIYEKMVVMPSNFMIGFDESLCAMILHATPVIVDRVVEELKSGQRHRLASYGIDRFASRLGYFEVFGGRIFGQHLKVNENCVDCGWCEKLCPRDNIKIIDGQHIFGNNCVICMRCIYGCPQRAIEPGIGKFMVVPEGFNLNKVENRMDHLTVYPRISQATNHSSLRGVRNYLIESNCFEI